MAPPSLGFETLTCAEYAFAAVARDYPSVLELVGNTPIVRLDALGRGVQPTLLAKLEYLNPGGSVKDRIGLAMIEKAEQEGKLRPGGTIVEPTSGNTGVGLAIAAAQKGYRCIFVMPDKMSQEKISMLRAYGAEVVITPTAVDHDSPESYYSVSDRLAEEIPGGFKPDQYSNMSNPEAHYRVTGPEIWEQTGGEIDAIVISVGTGGTISGVGRYFKERKPELLIVGADPEGSVYTAKDDNDIHPYFVEGIGKDTWPETMDPEVVDEWVRVSDRDSFLTARRLAREEGLLVGGSGGTTVWAALEVAKRFGPGATVLTMIPDSGRSYMSKFYDDNWMLEHGFVERRVPPPTVSELLRSKRVEEGEMPALVTIAAHQKVGEAIDVMQRYSISQLPVVRDGSVGSLADVIGSLQDRDLLDRVFKNPDALHEDVAAAMQPPLAAVDGSQTLDEVFATLTGRTNAVVVATDGKPVGVLTRSDLLEYLAHQRQT
jgi:cystathionine beta-synthase